MSVQSRVSWTAQQRVDLHDMLAMESFTAFDLRSLVAAFTGSDRAFVIRGFEVVGKTGLTINIRVADSLVYNPQDGNASFYVGLSDDANLNVNLPADQTNIFIEGVFTNESGSPVNRGLWDPLALSGEDASGTEFTSSVNFENKVVLTINVNTVGFSEGAIPLVRASTSSSAVTNMIDCRPMMWRLGTGGTNPDPLRKFEFSNSRQEPLASGTGVGDATDSPWRSRDSTGVINDKGFRSLKDWADAVMTRISEISGSALWYVNSTATAPAGGTSLSQTFFDTLGHSIQPDSTSAFKWKEQTGGLRLCGEGTLPGGSPWTNGLIRWKSNYTGLEWHLGNTFQSASVRSYTDLHFESPIPADGGNVFLLLEREVPKGSGNSVSWADNTAYPSFLATKAVSGVAGDFTGIALGDYIRKESEGYSRYYRVAKMSDGTGPGTFTIGANPNQVADNTIIALELENISNPAGVIVGGASNEPLRYFRSRYASVDLYADTALDTFNYQDADFYWLGRRVGDLFILKDFGTMQQGEEVPTLEATWSRGRQGGGNDLMLEKAYDSIYDDVDGYSLVSDASTTLLTIRRYVRNNTVESPTPGSDNSNALLEYTIAAPVGLMNDGDGLWVRLSNSAGGALANGSVTDATDALNNTTTTDNRWEVRSLANTPARTYDDKDVYLIARRITIGGNSALMFMDGTVLNDYGNLLNNHLEIVGDLQLTGRASDSILYIGDSVAGQVSTDPTNFFYDETGGIFGARTFRFSDNLVSLSTPDDVDFLPNLGLHTLTIGGALSTTIIPGDLIVQGNTIAAQVSEIQSEDKLITLGVGNPANGGYNSGIEVADNTISATDYSTTDTSPDIVLELGSAPGYGLGDVIGVSTADTMGGIPAGQIGGQYTIVGALSLAGDATISGTTLTIRTAQNASATEVSQPTATTSVFKSEWSIKVTGADGNLAGFTSWAIRVKGVATTPTVTPVVDYGVVPTAHSANMQATRIPYVNDDNAGPSDDSTLNFHANFTFDEGTETLNVTNINISGSFQWNYGSVQSANYAIQTSDVIIPFDTTGNIADITATLPASSAATKGKIYVLKDVGGECSQTGKRIIIATTGGDTIDDDSTLIMENDYVSFTLVDNGVDGFDII